MSSEIATEGIGQMEGAIEIIEATVEVPITQITYTVATEIMISKPCRRLFLVYYYD